MSELEHISSILSRALKGLEKSWEEQEEVCDLGKREIDASQESLDLFDDM